jgi:hypothetical protein
VKINKLFIIFTITILLLGCVNFNLDSSVYADDSSEKDKKEEKHLEEKEKRKDEIKEQQKQVKEKTEDEKLNQKELREEYQNKLEEKKKILSDFEKELKEKYLNLKNEYKEKYAQLRLSKTQGNFESSLTTSDNDELEIKLKELRLLEQEFREKIKNLKLEAKEHFSKLKDELKTQQDDDRKNKIRDRINELKEKYKDQLKEHTHRSLSDLEKYRTEYENKKINICHIPPGNPDAAHTIRVSVKAMEAHLVHGDKLGECQDLTDSDDNSTQGKHLEIKISEQLGMGDKTN